MPPFDGTTSWEQYRQKIVRSNGWDNDTAALQLFSHLEGDALNVALLVPLSCRLSRTGLVDRRVGWRITEDSLKGQLGQWGRTPPYLPQP